MITLSVCWFVVSLAVIGVVGFGDRFNRFDEKCRAKLFGLTNVQWLTLLVLVGPVGWVILFSLLPLLLCKSMIKRAWRYLGRYSIEITKE